MGIYDDDLDPGSTFTPTTVTTPSVLTKSIVLDNREVSKVSLDPNENSSTALTTAKALYEAWNQLKENIDEIDPNNNFFTDNTVVTLPLIETQFGQEGSSKWDIQNWERSDGKVVYVQDIALKNYIKIPSAVFTKPGFYFLVIEVEQIDSGKLVLYDNADTKLAEMTEFGKYSYELPITNSDVATLRFEAENVYPNEKIVISFVGFYFVTERIRDYVHNVILTVSGGGSVEMTDLKAAIAKVKVEVLQAVDEKDQVIASALTAHENNVDNPHDTTPAKIGAALANHTHTPVSIGAADKVHTHTPEEVGAAAVDHTHTPVSIDAADRQHSHSFSDLSISTDDLNFDNRYSKLDHNHDDAYAPLYHNHDTSYSSITHDHDSAYSKFTHDHDGTYSKTDHTHTLASLNAAAADHVHTPASIGAADADHLHAVYSLTTHTHTLDSLGAASATVITEHVNNKNNPHEVTYTKLGVGDKGTVFLNTGGLNPVSHVPMIRRLFICENDAEIEVCKNNIPSMKDMFNKWKRISHASTSSFPDIVPVADAQPAAPSELDTWEYILDDTGTGIIRNTTNSVSYIGFISPDKYDNYETEIIINADTNDDDVIGFIVAFVVDENGREHTLSVLRSPKCQWSLTYDYSNSTSKILQSHGSSLKWGNGNYGANATETGYTESGPTNPDGTGESGWSAHPGGTKIYVSRQGNIIVAKTTDIGEALQPYVADATLTFDISTNEFTQKFMRPCSIGFSVQSNPYTTWKTVYFKDPSSNIYDLTRNVALIYDKEDDAWTQNPSINIYDTMRVGTFGYNYLTKKFFFVNENSVEKIGISVPAIKETSGLAVDNDGCLYTDFTLLGENAEITMKSLSIRIPVQQTRSFFVNQTTGSDTLDAYRGEIEEKPFKTIQACIDYITSTYDFGKHNAEVYISSGTYNEYLELREFQRTTGYISLIDKEGTYGVTIVQNNKQTIEVSGGHYVLCGIVIKNTATAINDDISHFYSAIYVRNGKVDLEGCDIQQEYTGDAPTSGSVHLRTVSVFGNNAVVQFNPTSKERNHLRFHKGNATSMQVLLAQYEGTIQTQAGGTSQAVASIHCEGETTEFVVIDNSKFYTIGGATYLAKFVVDTDKTVTGKRYEITNRGYISTGNGGPEYFPGNTAGTLETDTYCVYK